MVVKQYVGARYVPKFANPVEWKSGTSYEALTIVTYNNTSYTSKIPVPPTVGNPSDNSAYWVRTGDYNAQVEQYREEANAVKNDLDTTKDNFNNEVARLNKSISNNTTDITNLHKFNVKRYGAKGDGITDDTIAIQNAINDCIKEKNYNGGTIFDKLNSGCVYFPDGKYLTTNRLLVDDGVFLLGESSTGTSIYNTESDIIYTDSTKEYIQNFRISNISFVGGRRGTSVINLKNRRLVHCEFDNIETRCNTSDTAFLLNGGWDNIFSNVNTKGCCVSLMSITNTFNNASFYSCSFFYPNIQCVNILGTDIGFYNCNFESINNSFKEHDETWKVYGVPEENQPTIKCGVYCNPTAANSCYNFIGCWFEDIGVSSDNDYGVGALCKTGICNFNIIGCQFANVKDLYFNNGNNLFINSTVRGNFQAIRSRTFSISNLKPNSLPDGSIVYNNDDENSSLQIVTKALTGNTRFSNAFVQIATLTFKCKAVNYFGAGQPIFNRTVLAINNTTNDTYYFQYTTDFNGTVCIKVFDGDMNLISDDREITIKVEYL